MKILCKNNCGFSDELVVGKVYEAEFGCWCAKGQHKMVNAQYPYSEYCTEHRSWTQWGYELVNERGEEDIWGYWNFEPIKNGNMPMPKREREGEVQDV